jgi:starvation-inducible outer membrane lipoprotein
MKFQIFFSVILLTACMHPISEQAREQVSSQTTFAMVNENPSAFLDQQLLIGGVIIAAEKDEEGTVLELMEWHLNRWGEPTYLADEGRRFLVKSKQSLDPAIYEPGVLVTLAGVVLGEEDRPHGAARSAMGFIFIPVRTTRIMLVEMSIPSAPPMIQDIASIHIPSTGIALQAISLGLELRMKVSNQNQKTSHPD